MYQKDILEKIRMPVDRNRYSLGMVVEYLPALIDPNFLQLWYNRMNNISIESS